MQTIFWLYGSERWFYETGENEGNRMYLWFSFFSDSENAHTQFIITDELYSIYIAQSCLIFWSLNWVKVWYKGASQVTLVVKNWPANAGDIRDVALSPGSERSPGGGYGNSLHYSCLENPMNRKAWWATALWVAKSWAQLNQLSTAHLI